MVPNLSKNKNTIIRTLITIALAALVCLLIYISLKSVLPGFIEVLVNGDNQELQLYLESYETFTAYLIAFLLQFIQIITIFLPSVPIQLAVGFMFGTWKGFLICYLGYVSANAVVFLSGRLLSGSLDKVLPSSSSTKNTKKANKLINSKYPAFMVFIASILPIIPNGLIPHAASKTKTKFASFMLAVGIGCIPTVFTLCAIGDQLNSYDFLTAALLCLPLFALAAILFWQQKNIIRLYEKLRDKLIKKTSPDEHAADNEKEKREND